MNFLTWLFLHQEQQQQQKNNCDCANVAIYNENITIESSILINNSSISINNYFSTPAWMKGKSDEQRI